jgi:hypothetical protein
MYFAELQSRTSGSIPIGKVSPETHEIQLQYCEENISEILRAVRQYWTPEAVSFSSPWLVCAILGPASINVERRQRIIVQWKQSQTGQNDLDRQLLLQVIKSFARYWQIAELMLSKLLSLPPVTFCSGLNMERELLLIILV